MRFSKQSHHPQTNHAPANNTGPRDALDRSLRSKLARLGLAAKNLWAWESCEPRLVMSAQLLTGVMDPLQLQHHGALGNSADDTTACLPAVLPDLSGNHVPSPHASAAHQQSGWSAVQSEFGLRGGGQTVAVIDSGIAWDHVALGKGFGAGYRVVGGWDFAENDANPYDDGPTGFHGTHVSGIIASDHTQYPGVAPDVDLVGLRVFNDAGQGQLAWVEQALAWVHTHRQAFANPITTVNLSLGSEWNSTTVPEWATLEDELKQLYDDGIVVVASAGNSFKQYQTAGLSYPAASPYVLPVASVDDSGALSDFSQRSQHVISAPGRNIMSTVPDHVLGRDGRVNDFSSATGTSMASPYVAGASVLVREAMEMVGIQDITPAKIINWLHTTADDVYDSITKLNYDRLDLHEAIDRLIPDDDVGDAVTTAQPIALGQSTLKSWINHQDDSDVFRFTAERSGRLELDADSEWLESLRWTLTSQGQSLTTAGLSESSAAIRAGETYELRVSADREIGPYEFHINFRADTTTAESGASSGNPGQIIDVGRVDYLDRPTQSGSLLKATAEHDGLFTVRWRNPDAAFGSLSVRSAAGGWLSDTTWADGELRLDIPAIAGQSFDIQLPGSPTDSGQLTLVDLVQLRGRELFVRDTSASDTVSLDLSRSISVGVAGIQYEFASSAVQRVVIDGAVDNDQLSVIGSALADRVEMRPGSFTLESTQLVVSARGMEKIDFDSGTGVADRLAMFDSDGDDVLTARASSAELTGLGYQFSVKNMDRYVINATGQGQDIAYLYDSAADDQLSVRPQFTSLWSDDYFVSVRGFERVFVYASGGGRDSADLYDSPGDDRFSTSGETASIVGPGFHSYTKFFESVHAHAGAGGRDVATLYGSNQQTEWLRGSDFVSFRESQWSRNAQGFEDAQAFVGGLAQSIPDATKTDPQGMLETGPVIDASGRIEASGVMDHSNVGHIDGSIAMTPPMGPATRAISERVMSELDLATELLSAVEQARVSTVGESSTSDLFFHEHPEAERELLDEVFARFGSMA